MSTRYYVGSCEDTWHNDANWSESSGGAGGASYPWVGDDAIFDANSGECTLDDDAVCDSITLAADFTAWFDADGYDVETVGDVLALASGGILALGEGTWTVGGDFQWVDMGTFDSETSTLIMTGTGSLLGSVLLPLCILTIDDMAETTVSVASYYGVSVADTCRIYGTAILNHRLEVGGNCDTYIGAGADISSPSHYLYFNASTNGHGLQQVANGADITSPIRFYRGGTTKVFAQGTYKGLVELITSSVLTASALSGTYNFEGGLFVQSDRADIAINVADGSRINVTDLTFNLVTADKSVTVSNSGSVDWNVTGDIGFTATTGDFTWTKGDGTITFSGGEDQTVDLADKTVEDVVIDKTAGTLTFTDGFTCDSFLATAGTIDFNGQTIESTGEFKLTSGVLIVAGADAMNGVAITAASFYAKGVSSASLLNLSATALWTLDVSGSTYAKYVDAAYCTAADSPVEAINSNDGGDNSGWTFVGVNAGSLALLGVGG